MESLQNTILIIEDDLGLNELISEKIQESGYQTRCALSAGEAIDWLSANKPFMMVVDYSLADMTAKEFIDDLKSKKIIIPPFIVSTGQGDERIAVEMMKLGARDYIIKDTNLLELLPSVIGRVVNEIQNENKLIETQDTLNQRESYLTAIFENLPGIMWLKDVDGKFIMSNKKFVKSCGKNTFEELQGNNDNDIWPEKIAEKFKNDDKTVILSKKTIQIEETNTDNGIENWFYTSKTPIFDEAKNVIGTAGYSIDITERKVLEDVGKFLITCGLKGSGEDFFESLAKYLSQSLEMEYVCIDTLDGDGLTAHTLAIYNYGKFDTNVSYTLKETPCGDVVGKTICCFPENVANLFPNDKALQELNAESYVGTTLWSFDGKPIGLIAVIGSKTLKNATLSENILRLVSVRAAGELERKKAEEALLKKIDELNYMNKFMVNREVRMAEMKKEINEMLVSVGKEKRYL